MARAILQNVSPKDLSIHLIDSHQGRMAYAARLIREVLADENTNLIDITESEHPEILRRELEKKSSNESSRFSARKYNIFLSRTYFDDFSQLVRNDHGRSFDDGRSVKKLSDHRGVLKMLMDYWRLLTDKKGSQFFTSFFVDSVEESEPRLDHGTDFDEAIHILNLPNPPTEPVTESATEPPKKNVMIPRLQYLEGYDYDYKIKSNLRDMFKHFDFVASLSMPKSSVL